MEHKVKLGITRGWYHARASSKFWYRAYFLTGILQNNEFVQRDQNGYEINSFVFCKEDALTSCLNIPVLLVFRVECDLDFGYNVMLPKTGKIQFEVTILDCWMVLKWKNIFSTFVFFLFVWENALISDNRNYDTAYNIL